MAPQTDVAVVTSAMRRNSSGSVAAVVRRASPRAAAFSESWHRAHTPHARESATLEAALEEAGPHAAVLRGELKGKRGREWLCGSS